MILFCTFTTCSVYTYICNMHVDLYKKHVDVHNLHVTGARRLCTYTCRYARRSATHSTWITLFCTSTTFSGCTYMCVHARTRAEKNVDVHNLHVEVHSCTYTTYWHCTYRFKCARIRTDMHTDVQPIPRRWFYFALLGHASAARRCAYMHVEVQKK